MKGNTKCNKCRRFYKHFWTIVLITTKCECKIITSLLHVFVGNILSVDQREVQTLGVMHVPLYYRPCTNYAQHSGAAGGREGCC